MKINSLLLLSSVALFAACESAEPEITEADILVEEMAIDTDEAKRGYMIGFQDANMLIQNQIVDLIDDEAYLQGFKDAIAGAEMKVDNDEAMVLLQEMQAEVQRLQMAPYESIKQEGMLFLAENAKKEGVNVLPSGLQYEELNKGNGKNPVEGEKCLVHYTGTFIDGTKFDSSYDRGEPYPVDIRGGVIPGWLEALSLMSKGSKWKIYIPFELAYGERGSQAIPPYSVLVFEMEVMDITK